MRKGTHAKLGLPWIRSLAVGVALAIAGFASDEQKPVSRPTPARDALRYDGKPFSYWRDLWRTELKASRRTEALEALATFGVRGYAREATATILDMVSEYKNPQAWSGGEDSTDPDTQVVAKACGALDKIGDASLPVLVEALHDSRATVRSFVADRLLGGDCTLPSSLAPALIRTIEDSDRDAAKSACSVLLYVDGFGAALKDSMRTPKQSAALVGALARLVTAGISRTDDVEASVSASMLLAEIGSAAHGAGPALEQAWRGSDESLRVASALALANMKLDPKHMIPSFEAALRDKEAMVRAIAARCLGLYGKCAAAAAPALRRALKDSKEYVRLAALLALGRIENNPHHTLNDFITASRVAADAESLADWLKIASAPQKSRLSNPWIAELWQRHAHASNQIPNPEYGWILAHVDMAPAVRKALPVIKEAARKLTSETDVRPAALPQSPPPPISSATDSAASSHAKVAAAIATALKKVPLDAAPAHRH
jgi:HEAT repeat protein